MALFTGLSPQDALAKWYDISQRGQNDPSSLTPEEKNSYDSNMVTLSKENPAAWTAVSQGINDTGKTRQIFNPQTGQWDTQQKKGFFSHPESWLQLGFGGALGGLAAAPLLAGESAAAGGSSASAAPIIGTGAGPMATGAVTADAAVPAALSTGTEAATGGAGLLSRVGGMLSGDQGQNLLTAAGQGLGGAANASAGNRLTSAELALRGQAGNTSAQSAFETELMNRAKEEMAQRASAERDLARASYVANRRPGPFETTPRMSFSPAYQQAMKNLETQGSAKIAQAPQYDTTLMPALNTTAMDQAAFMQKYGTPSALEKTSNWLSPTLSVLGKVARYF